MPEAVLRHLEQNKIFVRDISHLPDLQGFLRITVGTEEQVDVLTTCLSDIL